MLVYRSRVAAVLFGMWVFGCDSGAPSSSGPDEIVRAAGQALTAANCPAGYNVIQGTNSANTLIGTAGNDCIIGLGGSDTLWGRGGDDFIAGGNGDDTIEGEGGNDRLFGEASIDTIRGGADNDTIHGDDGNDLLYGNDGDDVIDGDANADQIWGGAGDDVVYGDAANDTLFGEDGDDALLGGAGTNTSNGGAGTDACTGTGCEKPALVPSGCTANAQCSSGAHCIADFGLCIGCVSDQDSDLVCDSKDGCPNDPQKAAVGVCGCGTADTDSDADGTPNCNDLCPSDAPKVAPGVCGCAVADTDSDADGTPNCDDLCPSDPLKVAGGLCGCNVADIDADSDGTPDCNDGCATDPAKTDPGFCGCGTSDVDGDGDGTVDCHDGCPADAYKVEEGACGCGISDTDSDNDGVADCNDLCAGSDDHIDTNQNEIPDGCDPAIGCTVSTPASPRTYVGDAYISNQAGIDALAGIECITGSLNVYSSDLSSLAGLSSLEGVGAALFIGTNPNLTSLDGLQAVQTIGMDLRIELNDALTSITALSGLTEVGAEVSVLGNPALVDLQGFDNLLMIGGRLRIYDNDALTSLTGLSPWLTVGSPYDGLLVADNASLPACALWPLQAQLGVGCGGVYGSCTGNTGTGGCGTLPPGFQCVPGAQGPGVYDGNAYIYPNGPVPTALADLAGVTCITGNLLLADTWLSDLSPLSHLQMVGARLAIEGSEMLTDADQLESLTSAGSLHVRNNLALASLAGLANLTALGPDPLGAPSLVISDNPNLPPCAVAQIEAQTDTECGDNQYYWCTGNTGTQACVQGPCATDNGGCDPLTACSQSGGVVSCGSCPPGFTGNGSTGCVDVDECALGTHDCAATATCSDHDGGFACTCPAGNLDILGDGTQCVLASQVAASKWHSCAITTAGELYCWGRNWEGQVGDGSGVLDRLSPVRVGSDSDWQSIAVGAYHS
ncbi:MAG TPA: hypothetical protein VK509_16970, partial [Polyangiales bacterium]|nr:hypothetical protein [Polyangiales bacterium]